MTLLSAALNATELLIDGAAESAEENGLSGISQALQVAGYATGEAASLAEENPEVALAAYVAAAVLVPLVAPELLAASAAELAASPLMAGVATAIEASAEAGGLSSSAAEILGANCINVASPLIIDLVAEQTTSGAVENLYTAANSLLSSIDGSLATVPITDTSVSTINASEVGSDNGELILPDANSSITSGDLLSLPSNSDSSQLILSSGQGQPITLVNGDWTSISVEQSTTNSITAIVAASDGTSQSIVLNDDGSTTDTTYSGPDATGTITSIDQENADGTSQITTYGTNGSTITANYSGPNGTGTSGSEILTAVNGTITGTVEIHQTELDFPAIRDGGSLQAETIDVSYLGGWFTGKYPNDGVLEVGAPWGELFSDWFVVQPFGLAELNATQNTGSIEIDSSHGFALGEVVTADIPVSLDIGNAESEVTTNVVAIQKVYEPADPTINFSGTSEGYYDFGTLHIGDTVSVQVTITNGATDALTDSLIVNPNSKENPFTMSGALATLQSGQSEVVTITFDTNKVGDFDKDIGPLSAISYDPDLPNITLSVPEVDITGVVESYAVPIFVDSDSIGNLVHNGSNWSINLGELQKSSSYEEFLIEVENRNQDNTDDLAGSFSKSGHGFSVSGATPFSYSAYLYVDVNLSDLGENSETIILYPLSQNDSGYSGTLQNQTLVITDDVVKKIPPQPTITGAVADQSVSDEAKIKPFAKVNISDSGVGQTETLSVTLSTPANGKLSNLDGGTYNKTTGVYSVKGSTSAVESALNGLVFTPTAHQVAPGETVTTNFIIKDKDSGGASATNAITSVIATAAAAGAAISLASDSSSVDQSLHAGVLGAVLGLSSSMTFVAGLNSMSAKSEIALSGTYLPGLAWNHQVAATSFGKYIPYIKELSQSGVSPCWLSTSFVGSSHPFATPSLSL